MSGATVRCALLAVAAAGATGLAVVHLEGGPGISDTAVYLRYGERIAGGDLPYRDFPVEYPPGALVPFVLPALVSETRDDYDSVFRALMLVSLAALAVLLVVALRSQRATALRITAAVGALLLGILALGPFLLTRFDLYAAVFALAALSALLHGRDRLGAALLGMAIATKIYPAVLLPLLVARIWRRDGRVDALRTLGLTVATAVVIYLPFLILAPEGVARSVWRQVGRPLQIESLGSAVLLALHHAAGMPLGWASGAGSQNLTGSVAAVASTVTTVAVVAGLAYVWWRFAAGDTESVARLTQYAAAATVAFVAFGKVLSPQFLVWLLAIVVLVPGRRGILATGLLLAACGLTRLWFPGSYWELVKQFDPTASWLVLVRDVVLVAVFASLVVTARGAEAGGSPSRAR